MGERSGRSPDGAGGGGAAWVRAADGGSVVRVRVQPGARDEGLGEVEGDALRVRVAAPPVEGAANEALIRLLARSVLGVAPSCLVVVRGAASRDKEVAVSGLDPGQVEAAVEAARAAPPGRRRRRRR